MLSLSPKILLLLLAILTFTTARPGDLSRATFVDVNVTEVGGTTHFNGYEVSGCGDPRDRTSKAIYILSFLYQMKQQLERVIADANLGTNSEHGYAAFFKSNRNIGKVVAMFEHFVRAWPIIVDADRAPLTEAQTRTPQPRFTCFDETDAKNAAFLRDCTDQPEKDQKFVLFWPGAEIMVVCPNFFTARQFPAAGRNCPELKNGKFSIGDEKLLKSLFAEMVYVLVLLYDRGIREDWTHRWDMQYAVELSSRHSLGFAENYAYYAGAVQGNCTSFPNVAGRRDELRLRQL